MNRPAEPDPDAIDAALNRGSDDPKIHAAALRQAFAAGADLGLRRSEAKLWMLGLDELIDGGALDAAAHATPLLAAAFPRTPFLETMALVFASLPAPTPGRPRFVDDRNRDVQVALAPGANTAVVAFCGIANRLGLPLSLIDRWLAPLGCHVIYVRDMSRQAYVRGIASLGPDLASAIAGIRREVAATGATRTVCLGNSMGAYAALRYAVELGADRVLALAPPTGDPAQIRAAAERDPRIDTSVWQDLVPLYSSADAPLARVVFGARNRGDRDQALRLAGLPRVFVEALTDWESHDLVTGFLKTGRLGRVFGWLTAASGGVEPEAVPATSLVYQDPPEPGLLARAASALRRVVNQQ